MFSAVRKEGATPEDRWIGAIHAAANAISWESEPAHQPPALLARNKHRIKVPAVFKAKSRGAEHELAEVAAPIGIAHADNAPARPLRHGAQRRERRISPSGLEEEARDIKPKLAPADRPLSIDPMDLAPQCPLHAFDRYRRFGADDGAIVAKTVESGPQLARGVLG